jgi:hypothetical protein
LCDFELKLLIFKENKKISFFSFWHFVADVAWPNVVNEAAIG